MAGYYFPGMLESEAQLGNHDSSRVFGNPRRGITLALLLLRLTGTCMVSLVCTPFPYAFWGNKLNRGRPLEFNHQWILCRKNPKIPPLTPSSCNTTNSCSYNRHEASLDLGIFAQLSKVMNLKIRMHFVWNTLYSVSANLRFQSSWYLVQNSEPLPDCLVPFFLLQLEWACILHRRVLGIQVTAGSGNPAINFPSVKQGRCQNQPMCFVGHQY